MMALMKRRRHGMAALPSLFHSIAASLPSFFTSGFASFRRRHFGGASFWRRRRRRRSFALFSGLLGDRLQASLAFRQPAHQTVLIAGDYIQFIQPSHNLCEFFFNAV